MGGSSSRLPLGSKKARLVMLSSTPVLPSLWVHSSVGRAGDS